MARARRSSALEGQELLFNALALRKGGRGFLTAGVGVGGRLDRCSPGGSGFCRRFGRLAFSGLRLGVDLRHGGGDWGSDGFERQLRGRVHGI
jgi:hypothetical protein